MEKQRIAVTSAKILNSLSMNNSMSSCPCPIIYGIYGNSDSMWRHCYYLWSLIRKVIICFIMEPPEILDSDWLGCGSKQQLLQITSENWSITITVIGFQCLFCSLAYSFRHNGALLEETLRGYKMTMNSFTTSETQSDGRCWPNNSRSEIKVFYLF